MPAELLSELIAAPARCRPDSVAYEFRDETLSYGELLRQADNLAVTLQQLGIQAGDRVGLLMHKSLRIPVAIYGVLRAGAIFVPMDPNAPAVRHAFIVDDCSIDVLIIDAKTTKLLENLPSAGAAANKSVGAEQLPRGIGHVGWQDATKGTHVPAPLPACDEDLAYIMYTSGSTGTPKGIMHSHASGLAYARMSAALYGVHCDDRIGGHAPLYTDMSTFAYFTGPLAGAASVIVPDDASIFPVQLARLISDSQITIWYSVPQVLVGLADRGNLAAVPCPQLRWILYGGEPIAVKHLAMLREHWPQIRIANVYGPAEVNQITHHEVTPADIEDGDIPIGRLCDDVHALIVDPASEQHPPALAGDDDIGELVVNTPTMMRGYWRQPDRNDAVFVDIDSPSGGSRRHFRTGDLVRRRNDDLLEFIGRKDRQVKLRGFRVELDGVEAMLTSHPQVAETAAMVRDSGAGAALIVAVRASADSDLDADELETTLLKFCRARLPRYAIPSQLAVVQEFPRTGGKIDRRKLLVQLVDASSS